MIKKQFIVMLLLSLSCMLTHADICQNKDNKTICGEGTLNKLNEIGFVKTKNTTVTGKTNINGTLYADHSTFTSLKVNFEARLEHCVVEHDASIKTLYYAVSTDFKGNLDVFSDSTVLEKSIVAKNIHVYHTDKNIQAVYIEDESKVLGDIIFDDGQGIVIQEENSEIAGKVIGGHVFVKKD